MKLLNYLIIVAVAICLVQLSLGLNSLDYTKPSKEVGKRLRLQKLPGYPHEYGFGYYYQGDILLRPGEKSRIAITRPTNYDVWPNATVPYGRVHITAHETSKKAEVIQNFKKIGSCPGRVHKSRSERGFGNYTWDLREVKKDLEIIPAIRIRIPPDEERLILYAAFAQYANKTCVRFVQRTDELQYVTITNNGEGCYSNIGRNPNPVNNKLNLQTPSCMRTVRTPVHEMMHTLGFLHEQSRRDRDTYIQFFPQNLAPKHQNANFIKTNFGIYNGSSTTYGAPYNYGSVMHYSRFAGAATEIFPVLVRRDNPDAELGNDYGLSDGDVAQIKARYCPDD